MNKVRWSIKLLLVGMLFILLVGCTGADDSNTSQTPAASEQGGGLDAPDLTGADTDAADIEAWLERVRSGDLPAVSMDESFDWGMGYLVYYGPVETLVVDNLIYNALRAHHRAQSGEATDATTSRNDQNLIELTEGIVFDPAVDPTEQIAQTPEIRQAIMDRIVSSQQGLSPDEALASNEVIGIIAPPVPQALGGKYLVYTQETPDSDFNFLGVVIVADATATGTREPYSHQGWDNLSWLGDAAGPFWNDLPTGVSGDPTNTNEGRPGVLLISEDSYEMISQRN